MKGKPGYAVQVSSSNEVVLSVDAPGATTFLLVACRAWNTVSEALRPINQSINQHELAMAPHIQSAGAPEIQ